MNIIQLRHFVAVARHLNFTAAAKELYIAQPGLSLSIARLEKNLNVKLLERNRHQVTLTESGEVLLKEAEIIINQFDTSMEKVRKSTIEASNTLQIGYLPTLGAKNLPSWIKSFRKNYPFVKLTTKLCTEAAIMQSLDEDYIDLVYTRYFPEFYGQAYDWFLVSTESASFIVDADHPYAHKKKIDFTSLCREQLVLMHPNASPGWHQFILKHYEKKDIQPHVVELTHRMDALISKVAFGGIISIIPSCAQTQSNESVCFIEIQDPDLSFEVGFIWKKGNANINLQFFIDYLNNNFV